MENGRLDRKKTLTMNWAGLGDVDDFDDDHFFDSRQRLSAAVPFDLESSSDDDDYFDDSRTSFSSGIPVLPSGRMEFQNPAASPDYDIWMSAPGSITERRRRLLDGLGLGSRKNILGANSIQRAVSRKQPVDSDQKVQTDQQGDKDNVLEEKKEVHQSPPVRMMVVRSRSDTDIEAFLAEKQRKEEMLGKISKTRLTRTSSGITAPCKRICRNQQPARASTRTRGHSLTPVLSNTQFGAFFLIKSLDNGKEFVVNGRDQDGTWNRLSDLQTGKQLTMEEFDKSVGYSPVVNELMRRDKVDPMMEIRKLHSYVSKSLRMSKRRGAALLKNIKGVANSMSSRGVEKDKDVISPSNSGPNSPRPIDQKQDKKNDGSNSSQWVKVRPTGKSYKELSALHLSQEIQAHQGAIWALKFSLDARFLASAGEDRVIHVWEVQECEIMSLNEGGLTPVHPSMAGGLSPIHPSMSGGSSPIHPSMSGGSSPIHPSMEKPGGAGDSEKKKKGKCPSGRKGNQIPEYVHVPEGVFSLSDKPICSFTGHSDDVLDMSWSRSQLLLSSSMDKTVRLWDLENKSCLKLFAHNDYVTCIQFNPMDEDYFISGSLDAKVRIWNVPDRHVVDWTDLNEMVTAACYTPDGKGALIGSHKGTCRHYSTEDGKLNQINQIDMQTKKKAQAKKITGFQFSPHNPLEALVTAADSRVRIVEGSELIHKFKGFRNTSSQISASYTLDGKYIVCASEDSQVYIWKRGDQRAGNTGRRPAVTTSSSYEQFPCKDVSAAIPWHGVVRGEPPPIQVNSKKQTKKASTVSPTAEESSAVTSTSNGKKSNLPPLPKKNNTNNVDGTDTQPEEEHGVISRSESGINNGESIRPGESPSISASSKTSWFWFDGIGGHGTQAIQPTAWGMVIVTATLGGEIKTYQNFGLPRRIGRQSSHLF